MGFDIAFVESEFPWFFPVVTFIFGAMIGSFLNVVIYRVPAGKSIVRPARTAVAANPSRGMTICPF